METNCTEHRRNSTIQDDGILPEDILIEILSTLPVKDLIRLQCVCKSWCSLINDINFIKLHYRLNYFICKADADNDYFLHCDGTKTYNSCYDLKLSLLSKQTGNNNIPLDLTPKLLVDTAIVGTAQGVVCILWMKYQNLGLWNPATREFKALTPWESSYCVETFSVEPELIGFGFDFLSDDFKTLRGKRYPRDETQCYEIHSLKTNSWKRIPEPTDSVYFESFVMGAYLNGVGYWIVYASDTRKQKSLSDRVPIILSFNFHTEVFEICNPPDDVILRQSLPYFYEQDVAVYKDRLAIFVWRTDGNTGECQFDVWVATDVDGNSGTPLSWQHLFTSSNMNDRRSEFVHRVYNPITEIFKNMRSKRCKYFEYVESLFPLSRETGLNTRGTALEN
ncbi:putative F-box protein At3g16210 [Silene latifolia]|uniref:putative F-box protein At3g16210 n=1 Tax=Silene latifolia TaxID=37657 RepID=UPI003D780918